MYMPFIEQVSPRRLSELGLGKRGIWILGPFQEETVSGTHLLEMAPVGKPGLVYGRISQPGHWWHFVLDNSLL